jgi:hypothetical protein
MIVPMASECAVGCAQAAEANYGFALHFNNFRNQV